MINRGKTTIAQKVSHQVKNCLSPILKKAQAPILCV